MPFVTISNNRVEIDKYGYVVGSEVNELLHTPHGVINLRLRRRVDGRRVVVDADMWQCAKDGDLNNTITTFRAGVFMVWHGGMYRIDSAYYRDCNDFWSELERLVSNVIMTHEYGCRDCYSLRPWRSNEHIAMRF